jgi:hypothetical protein
MVHTFIPYCNFAISGDSEIKVKSFLRKVNGRGTMRPMKMDISVTRRRKTCKGMMSVSGPSHSNAACHDKSLTHMPVKFHKGRV